METKAKTLLEFMACCPPALCRIMAIESGKGKKTRLRTNSAIAKTGKLSRRMVIRLSNSGSWRNARIETASRFIEACRVDIFHKHPIKGTNLMTVYYFYRNFIVKGLTYLTASQKKRIFKILQW